MPAKSATGACTNPLIRPWVHFPFKEWCLQQFESCLFYSLIPPGPNILTFRERQDLEGRMSPWKHQVLFVVLAKGPDQKMAPRFESCFHNRKSRWGIMEDRIFCTTQEKMRARIWSPSWILPLSTLGSLCSGEESNTFVFLVECKAHSFSTRPVLPAWFTYSFFYCRRSFDFWTIIYIQENLFLFFVYFYIFCIEICSFVNPILKI